MAAFLTKDEELNLGVEVQEMLKAQEVLKTTSVNSEEVALLNQKVTRGNLAAEKLVMAHMPLVYSRANSFKSRFPSAPDIEDLAQEGMTGLMKAVYKYDPSMGNKFTTFAYYWIVQSIGRGTNSTGRLVRLPENRVQDYINIKRSQEAFREQGVPASDIDRRVREELNLNREEFINVTNAAANHASLNKIVSGSDGSNKELMDYVGDSHAEDSSEESVMKDEMFGILNEILGGMSQIKKDIISSSFVMDFDGEPLSPREIREDHNLSSQKFKKIMNEALGEIEVELDGLGIKFEDFLS